MSIKEALSLKGSSHIIRIKEYSLNIVAERMKSMAGVSASDIKAHLFHEGRLYESYRFFGAHQTEQDGRQGFRFCVWARMRRRFESPERLTAGPVSCTEWKASSGRHMGTVYPRYWRRGAV
ncbi:hypothetical protein PO124_17915 [Bacillus licheniformis]|nr:hypothetical protein [Bacillus licheniformis]